MKIQIFILAALLGTASKGRAIPLLGDFAAYKTTEIFDCGQQSEVSKKSVEVMSASSDSNGNQYLQVITRTQVGDGPMASYESFLNASRFYDGRDFPTESRLRTYCSEQAHGIIESVTVPAGHFLTCAVSQSTDYGWTLKTWIGPVALGIVKRVAQKNNQNDPSCSRLSIDELSSGSF